VTDQTSWRADPDSHPSGFAMCDANRSPLHIRRPTVRADRLEHSLDDPRRREGRGREPFVEVA
jgi:hypothetical protein